MILLRYLANISASWFLLLMPYNGLASETHKFAKLYDGSHRLRGAVSFLQAFKTKFGMDADGNLPAKIISVDGKEIIDDSVAYELIPGVHKVAGRCQGTDKNNSDFLFTIWMKPDYAYEMQAVPAGRSCQLILNDIGRLHKDIEIETPPGEPLLSSAEYHSRLEDYAAYHPGLWPDATSAIYKFITEQYRCQTYSIKKVTRKGTGRIWIKPGNDSLSITGDMREIWKIQTCGNERALEIRFSQKGNYGKYFFIRDVTDKFQSYL
jgi:hypothetical protein